MHTLGKKHEPVLIVTVGCYFPTSATFLLINSDVTHIFKKMSSFRTLIDPLQYMLLLQKYFQRHLKAAS